jgi:hypothetical protein
LFVSVPLLAALVVSQTVYPLNYSEFIESFSKGPLANRLFWINAAKNLLWLSSIAAAAFFLARNHRQPA